MFRSLKYLKQAFTKQKVVYSMDQKKMVKALEFLKKVFDKHEILFWLDGGTLIGAVREGKIIPWDDDIDVCTWIYDAEKIADARKDFEESEFELYVIPLHIPTYGFGHYAVRERKTKKHLLCILAAYTEKNHVVRARVLPVAGNTVRYFHIIKCDWLARLSWRMLVKLHLYKDMVLRYPVKSFGKPKTIKFYGKSYHVPGNIDECLTFMYGNWKKPQKDIRGVDRKFLRDV